MQLNFRIRPWFSIKGNIFRRQTNQNVAGARVDERSNKKKTMGNGNSIMENNNVYGRDKWEASFVPSPTKTIFHSFQHPKWGGRGAVWSGEKINRQQEQENKNTLQTLGVGILCSRDIRIVSQGKREKDCRKQGQWNLLKTNNAQNM